MSFNILRAVANRLTSTSTETLPQQIGYLANSLSNCKDVLSNASPSNDEGVIIHKLKTKVSSLLQDRTPEGRLCGMIVAKALIEYGGQTVLLSSANWTRALISCLGKSDSTESKRLCIVIITRLYLLTAENQTLVREITTPTLPAFITATLSIIKPSSSSTDGRTRKSLSPLLDVVLRSWYKVLQAFPGTCRPYVNSIKSICLSVISDFDCQYGTRQTAIDTVAIIHVCAPKGNGPKDWLELCQQSIEAVHDTADLAFRAIHEDWTPLTNRVSKVAKKQRTAAVPNTSTVDVLGLDLWAGVTRGCGRIIQQLKIIEALLRQPHAAQVNIPLGNIIDMTGRLNAVTLPTSKFALRQNNEVTKEERDELWLNVTQIHVIATDIFKTLTETYGMLSIPICRSMIAQVWDVLDAEQHSTALRTAAYEFLVVIIPTNMYNLRKSEHKTWTRLIQDCCKDLLPFNSNSGPSATLQTTTLSQNTSSTSTQYLYKPATISRLYTAASRLLPQLLQCNELQKLPNYRSLRAHLDQTAIFTCHEEALLSSVVNPHRGKHSPSLLPFLARMGQKDAGSNGRLFNLANEVLLRPRFPVITSLLDPVMVNGRPEVDNLNGEDAMADIEEEDAFTQGNRETDENSRISSVEHSVEDGSDSSRKRDFTTLLEQSTDAQLAHSEMIGISHNVEQFSGHGVNIAANDIGQPIIKKPRLSPDSELPFSEVIKHDGNGLSSQEINHAETSLKPAEAIYTPELPKQTGNEISMFDKGKNKADYESDSDNSEIPAINATLAGFTDDEDDGEE